MVEMARTSRARCAVLAATVISLGLENTFCFHVEELEKH